MGAIMEPIGGSGGHNYTKLAHSLSLSCFLSFEEMLALSTTRFNFAILENFSHFRQS